jgi:hypothetical protein
VTSSQAIVGIVFEHISIEILYFKIARIQIVLSDECTQIMNIDHLRQLTDPAVAKALAGQAAQLAFGDIHTLGKLPEPEFTHRFW